MGRKKIEIEKIQSLKPRHVTFSKRRSGLFKKAQTQDALCGSETTIVVFSPGGRVFTYGNPRVLNRFVAEHGDAMDDDNNDQVGSSHVSMQSQETMAEDGNRERDEAEESKNNSSVDSLLEELQERKTAVEELLAKVRGKLDKSWLSL